MNLRRNITFHSSTHEAQNPFLLGDLANVRRHTGERFSIGKSKKDRQRGYVPSYCCYKGKCHTVKSNLAYRGTCTRFTKRFPLMYNVQVVLV
jgi:hypothetical protein